LLAILAAEILPIMALIFVVIIYGLIRQPDSPTPEAFAPQAGNWIGPIGGFLSVLCFSALVALTSSNRPFAHGLSVGLGTAALDFCLGLSMGGGRRPELLVLIASNAGRIIAGVLGGWLGSKRRPAV
jgi:hypothetical protein